MDQKEIDKQRRCSHLLPAPGGEVVCGLLDEIEKLQTEKSVPTCCVAAIKDGEAFIKRDTGQVYVRADADMGISVVRCIRVLPEVGIVLLTGGLCVERVNLDIKWSLA
jgi:hypothetical protein